MKNRIMELIQNADMVLIGIGEEFEGERYLKQISEYKELREKVELAGQDWLIPSLNRFFLDRVHGTENQIIKALENLAGIVKDKNYFLVSVATNDYVWETGFKEERIVAPCGGSLKKQCKEGAGCEEAPMLLNEKEQIAIAQYFEKYMEAYVMIDLEKCPTCGAPMILNNIYTERYDERGYLNQWQKYTKWLQGTLNKKLCILELGVGMQCPSVIRFPFEKIGYFNQKADFVRVNKNLYQLTEELKEKGVSISENAVDWLSSMW